MKFTIALLVLVCAIVSTAKSDPNKEIEDQLNKALDGHTYTIRNFYVGEHLVYNANGELISGGIPTEWMYAQFHAKHVELLATTLVLKGHPACVVPKSNTDFTVFVDSDKMQIDLPLPHSDMSEAGIEGDLKKIFMTKDEQLVTAAPPPPSVPQRVKTAPQEHSKVSRDNVSPPRPISNPLPSIRPGEGQVILWIVIGED